ncbi:unnamed protein product [Caenorhabditis auriculariae]|uniref:Uncharacterized protein n=1 Tax=Caenorhabditis auriculariae TaxID=2777116 RepID=A0A8S1GPN5_9PELO|nr:unnamed protein product [Caenorhabditis auriculariae]
MLDAYYPYIGKAAKALALTKAGAAASEKTSRLAKSTVVAVLGWGGATDKQLSRYSKIYQERGFTTVQFTALMQSQGSGLKNLRETSSLAEALEKQLADGKRLALHLMSMNSICAFVALVQKYPHLRILDRSDGIFFDSCPIDFNSPANIWAFKNVIDHVNISFLQTCTRPQFALYFLWRIFTMVAFIKDIYLQQAKNMLGFPGGSYHFLLTSNLPKVMAVVYSDADETCPPQTIERFHKAMAARPGAQVEARRFSDTQHVQHLRGQPQEYLGLVDRFITRIEQQRLPASKI